MNFRQKIALTLTDLVVLAELGIGMYLASQDPENFTPIFLKVFFSLLIPTLALSWVGIRNLRSKKEGDIRL